MASAKQKQGKAKGEPRARLTGAEVARLAVDLDLSIDTVRRWAAGAKVNEGNAKRLARGAQKYGIEVMA